MQRKAVSAATHHADVPASVHEVLRTPGQPLDQATRSFMEPRFVYNFSSVPAHALQESTHGGLTIGPAGDAYEQEADHIANTVVQQPETSSEQSQGARPGYDFSHVRIHTGAKAAESAAALNARAYTVGHNIVFGQGQYVPSSLETRRLLAHELSHVVQQKSARSQLQRAPKGKDITTVKNPKLSLYQAGWTAESFFKMLATSKASQIRALKLDPAAEDCPEKASYGPVPYSTGEEIVNTISKVYSCTGSKLKEMHIFSHGGSGGIYGGDFEQHGLYSEGPEEVQREGGGRNVTDIPTEALATDAMFVFHGCSTAAGEDSFAQKTAEAILGTSPKAKVYGHYLSGVCGRDSDWKEFSKKSPKGKKTTATFAPPKKKS